MAPAGNVTFSERIKAKKSKMENSSICMIMLSEICGAKTRWGCTVDHTKERKVFFLSRRLYGGSYSISQLFLS